MRASFARLVTVAIALIAVTAGAARAQSFDHSEYDALLKQHVARGIVDYDAFASAPAFPRYLARLAAVDPASFPRDEQLALWINAYNAYTIQLVNAHHERSSIRNINKSFGFVKAYGPWREKLAVVNGHAYGLDDIEQTLIRGQFKEPRIHFALVCAAVGCPPLRSEAYVGSRLNEQLDDQARIFVVDSPAKNRVDVATRTVYLSPIFVEFRDYIKDFGGSEASVGTFIARFYPPGAERDLLTTGQFTVSKTPYDWSLNSKDHVRR